MHLHSEPKQIGYSVATLTVRGKGTTRKKPSVVQLPRYFEKADNEGTNTFVQRVLISASVCVDAGVDCDDTALDNRMGMPTSITRFAQEMVRCGRMVRGDHEIIKNTRDLVLNLKKFTCLNERLF